MKEMIIIKHIKGTYSEGYGIVLSNGNEAKLIKFEKHTGIPTTEKMTYIEKRFKIYCKRQNLKMI